MASAESTATSQNEAQLLAGFRDDGAALRGDEVQQAIHIARQLQTRARDLQTPAERRQQAELDRMIQSPSDKATLIEITDQAFRAARSGRAADQLIHILDVQGVPRFFSPIERTMLRGFQSFGAYLPGVAMPLVKEKMREETANVILPAEEDLLREHLEERRREGLRMNVNYLGEALLGEEEATRRLQKYLEALQRPEMEVISVKISTIFSQISAIGREDTVDVLADRLELLYRAAAKGRFTRAARSSHPEVRRGVRSEDLRPDSWEDLGVTGAGAGGESVPKFVYLDMEEYRDKEITAEAFTRTLDRQGLEQVRAGIALQAYIPDSFATQQRITEWSKQRVANGGAPVTIRLVKGANMEMERVEASIKGWPLATYCDKVDTDANYHRMLQYGMQPENLAAVRLGIASHNLFTLAYGLVLAARSGRIDHAQFEMLEGMANHQRRALVELVGDMLLYAPACRQDEFINAIGYLVRRLDENTGPDNFLRYAFNLEVDSPTWNRLEQGFVESFKRIESLSDKPRRTQDRSQEASPRRAGGVSPLPNVSITGGVVTASRQGAYAPRSPDSSFANESDTDWSLPQNSQWAADIVAAWQPLHGDHAVDVPLVIAGEELREHGEQRHSIDPSRPELKVACYRQATSELVDRAVACAVDDPGGWRRRSPRERTEILHRVAEELARRRGDLMGAMMAEGGKVLTESDSEVSEAIDFCRFYSQSAEAIVDSPWLALRASGRGVVVVVSPWNFPLAIPCGGVAAALAAGNTVILKSASHTVMIAYLMCECFWAGGVPRTALQFAPCSGATVGQQLVSHDAVDAVVLTGGTATALEMLRHKPTMHLLAETGGKNATIVTALSDRDLAIKNVLHSAFSHAGQKCSATSLLILEEEVYHDRKFRETLVDAVESMRVGSAWELPTRINPLIWPPSGELERALKELEPGESWAVMPRFHVDGNPHLVSPGVKWGVQPDSVTHCTEFFGPMLGVMAAKNLDHAIDLVNATGYGLTSGLETLDDREQELWQSRIRAGNLYINRSTTGAIVLRQPFGGMGKSAFGPGIKAGGPNYVVPLMKFEQRSQGSGDRSQGTPSSPALDDAIVPPTTLTIPHQSLAERRQNLHTLRDALAVLREPAPFTAEAVAQLNAAMESYLHWAIEEFGASHDTFRLIGEDNYRRYLPVTPIRIRIHQDDSPFEIFARAAASAAAGCRSVISIPPELSGPARDAATMLDRLTDPWAASIEFVEESDEGLAEAMKSGATRRVRYAHQARVPEAIRRASAESYVYIADAPVLAEGRVELLWYLQEQSLSHVYHRYGNLGRRSEEERAPVL